MAAEVLSSMGCPTGGRAWTRHRSVRSLMLFASVSFLSSSPMSVFLGSRSRERGWRDRSRFRATRFQ
jgi:hypothetical protein